VTGGRERVRQDVDRVERVGWMVKSSRRYVGWEATVRPTFTSEIIPIVGVIELQAIEMLYLKYI